jgi:hypothetical protein
MELVPEGRVVATKVAFPLLRVPVPREVVPSMNVTVPLTVPPVAGATVAVKVTEAPTVDGLSEEVTLVVVAAALVT